MSTPLSRELLPLNAGPTHDPLPRHDAGGSLRHLLRQSTHAEHAQLNRQPLLAGITQAGYPIEHYRLLLAAYMPFYQALEHAIGGFSQRSAVSFAYTPKLPWLLADLQHFGGGPDEVSSGPQLTSAVFEINTLGHLLGVLYAVEGATLGGQLIARQVAAHLGLKANAGARFFNGYGPQTAHRWEQFLVYLEMHGSDAVVRDQAVSAAKTTFSRVREVLDRYQADAHVE